MEEKAPVRSNAAGAVTRNYFDADGLLRGYLRTPDGTTTTFGPATPTNVVPTSINAIGGRRRIL
jgi:hypothetical protein